MKNTEFSLNITTLDFLKKIVYNIIVEKSRKEEHGMDKTLEILAEKGYNINNIVAILKLKNGEKDKDQIDKDIVFMLPSFDELVLKKSLITNVQIAKNKEALLEIIDNKNLSDEQKEDAVAQMIAMTEIAEQEASVETLLLSKGFSEVVVNLTKTSADVVVNATELTEANLAQIEDIITRKTNIEPENIVITATRE